jgi:Flp pilus assembly protein TadG
MKRRRDRESGVTVVEFVVLTPILFFLMFGSVDIGLALFARHVAVSAAQEGARVAREDAADPNADWQTSSTAAASNWVTSLLGDLVVADPNTPMANSFAPVPLDEPFPQVGVTVNFSIISLMPGLRFTENASSVGPVECFYTLAGVCDGE